MDECNDSSSAGGREQSAGIPAHNTRYGKIVQYR
jgi:hypothetical protein